MGGREGLDRHRADRSDPRDRHQASRFFVLTRAGSDLLFQPADLLIETGDPIKQKAAQPAHRARQARTRIVEGRCQPTDVCRIRDVALMRSAASRSRSGTPAEASTSSASFSYSPVRST